MTCGVIADILKLIAAILTAIFLLCVSRLLWILPSFRTQPRTPPKSPGKVKIVVVLGSGGHTAEMIRLLGSLDFEKYSQRTYVVSSGDTLSEGKARDLEKRKQNGKAAQSKVRP